MENVWSLEFGGVERCEVERHIPVSLVFDTPRVTADVGPNYTTHVTPKAPHSNGCFDACKRTTSLNEQWGCLVLMLSFERIISMS